MRLYIVRHGETDWNRIHRVQGRTDIPLNDYGRHLARETAEGMKDVRIDLGYTSPLLRAKETAQILLGDRDVPLYEDSRIEELSFGSYEGMRTGGEEKDEESEAFQRFFTDTALTQRTISRRRMGRQSRSSMSGPGISSRRYAQEKNFRIKVSSYPHTGPR